MRQRKDAAIVETARTLFLSRGYDGTSLDDVAAACGVSKTTVYNNFADKEALFTAVVTDVIDRAEQVASALASDLTAHGTAQERLRSAARRLVVGVLNPTVVQLRRLAITQAERFPELVETYWQHAPARSLSILEAEFGRMSRAGELDCPAPASAARQFAYAVLGPAQDRALLLPGSPQTENELMDEADRAVDAFLRAYAP